MLLPFIVALAACAAVLGLDPLTPYEGGDLTEAGEAGDGGVVQEGGGTTPGAEGGTVGEIGKAPCDLSETPPPYGTAVYVSERTGQAEAGAANGQPDNPFKTIGAALGAAKALDATVVVLDEGTYAEKILVEGFPKGIKLDGAWSRVGAVWARDCADNRALKTLIQSPDDVGIVLHDLSVRSVLSNLAVRSRAASDTAADEPGSSRFGVITKNSIVALENVSVVVSNASPGGAATGGTPGAPLCPTSTTCNPNPVAGADAPPASAATASGVFSTAGFTPADGVAGLAAGGEGSNGTPGGGGNTRNDCETGCSAGDGCKSVTGSVSSSAGQCGCGGSGGAPGKQGRGGGASVALLAVGGTVSVKFSDLTAGNGGDGSAGGAGGAGGAPTNGAVGAVPNKCWGPGCCEVGSCPSSCGCYGKGNWSPQFCPPGPPAERPLAGGAPGGPGMSGGKGSNGGGGAGGPAYSYVPLEGAQVLVAESKRTFGNGGAGPGGALGGAAGEKP